jgi:hypothetical protein
MADDMIRSSPEHIDGGATIRSRSTSGCPLQPHIHPAMEERSEVLSGHPSFLAAGSGRQPARAITVFPPAGGTPIPTAATKWAGVDEVPR